MNERIIREIIEKQTLLTTHARTTVSDAAVLMKGNKVGAVLVMQDETLAGIFTERDAVFHVLAEGLDPRTTPLEKVMTRSPTTISPDRPFGHALHLMFEGGFRHVPVV